MQIAGIVLGFLGSLTGVGIGVAALMGALIGNTVGGTISSGLAAMAMVVSVAALAGAVAMTKYWRSSALLMAIMGALGLLALPEFFAIPAIMLITPAALYAINALMLRRRELSGVVREGHSAFAQSDDPLEFDDEPDHDAHYGAAEDKGSADVKSVGKNDGASDEDDAAPQTVGNVFHLAAQLMHDEDTERVTHNEGEKIPELDNVIDINEARVTCEQTKAKIDADAHAKAEPKAAIAGQATEPIAQPETVPIVMPDIQPTGMPEGQPIVLPVIEPASRPEIEPREQTYAQPSGRPEIEPAGKPEIEPIARPEIEPIGKPDAAPIVRPEMEPIAQPEIGPIAMAAGETAEALISEEAVQLETPVLPLEPVTLTEPVMPQVFQGPLIEPKTAGLDKDLADIGEVPIKKKMQRGMRSRQLKK